MPAPETAPEALPATAEPAPPPEAPLRLRDPREWLGPGLCIALVTYMYGRFLRGEFPVSHDHPAHMFNAWLTSDVLIPSGRLSGWSELWFAGYPAGELYGPGGNLWVALFRFLTLGQLDYGATYGLAMFGLMLLIPLSTYVMGRAFFGRAVGTIAALMMVLTRGGWYDLGWFWIVEMGVWPFALGAALTVLATVALRRYLVRGGPRGLAVASLAVALAVLGHPMSLLLLGFAGPLMVIHHGLEHGRAGATRALLRAAGAASLGILLSAFWLVPFVAKSAYSQKLGEIWLTYDEAVPTALQLNLLGPEWRLAVAFAFCGLVIAVLKRQLWALYLASSSAIMLLFATATTQYDLRLFDVLSPLASIQYPRFLGFVRIFVYLLCAYGLVELWGLTRPMRQRLIALNRGARIRAVVAMLLPLLLALPLTGALVDYLEQNHWPSKGETFRTPNEVSWYADYVQAAEWVKGEMDGQPWSRVGAFGHPYDHILSTLPIYTGLPVYTGGFVPAHTYRFFFDGQRDADMLTAVGVRYVLATPGWGREHPTAVPREVFGAVHVFELPTTAPARATAVGDCQVSVAESGSDSDHLTIAVEGVTEPCRVRIHRSDFPNWKARFTSLAGGEEQALDIERITPYAASHYAAFMSVVVPANGTLQVAWEPTPSDTIGRATSGVAWFFFALLVLFSFKRQWLERLLARLPSVSPALTTWGTRAVWATAGLLVVVGTALGVGRAREASYTFDRHVSAAEKTVTRGDQEFACGPAEVGTGWTCGEGWDRIDSGLFSYVYDSRYCIFVHPSPHGDKHLTFRNVPLGRRLSGFYGLLDTSKGRGKVQMDVTVGVAPTITFETEEIGKVIGLELFTTPGPADVRISVRAERPEWRHLCFNLQVLDD